MKAPLRRHRQRGLTLVELVVVLAVIGLLAAIAVPGLARLGIFSRNELQHTARDVYSMMRAARIYAQTYQVDTAVAYSLDNWVDPIANPENSPGLFEPVVDSVTGATVRVVVGAGIMYRLPGEFRSCYAGLPEDAFVPVPGELGDFRTFPGGMVMFLDQPAEGVPHGVEPLFFSDRPRLDSLGELGQLGMNRVEFLLDDTGPRALIPEQAGVDPGAIRCIAANQTPPVTASLPAHIFSPGGRLRLPDGAAPPERIELRVGPSPTLDPELRIIDPANIELRDNRVSVPLHLYRSTGRVRIPT